MDSLFHVLIPVMLALVANVDRKRALMLAPIALIPDLDVLLMAHRIYLHTIFVPLAIALVPFFLRSLGRREHRNLFLLASFYYLSALVLDSFPGPVAILWPLTNVGYGLWVWVGFSQQSVIPMIRPYAMINVKEMQVPNVVTDAAVVTPQSIATALLFVSIILISELRKRL